MQFGVCDDLAHFAQTLGAAADIGEVHLVAGWYKSRSAHDVPRHNGKCK